MSFLKLFARGWLYVQTTLILRLARLLPKGTYLHHSNGSYTLVACFQSERKVCAIHHSLFGQLRSELITEFKTHLQEATQHQPLSIVDVGARGNTEIIKWGDLAKHVQWYGFEIDESACTEAQRIDAENGIRSQYFPVMVAAENGKRELHYKRVPTASSLYGNDQFQFMSHWRGVARGATLDHQDRLEILKVQPVATTSLDDWRAANRVGQVDFLKVDAEGAEFEILSGASDVLATTLGVALEVDFVERFNPLNHFYEIDRLLKNSGFCFFDLSRKLRTGFSGSHSEYVELVDGSEYSHGQVYGGDVIYLRDPWHEKSKSFELCRERLTKLATIALVNDQFEFAIKTLELAKSKAER